MSNSACTSNPLQPLYLLNLLPETLATHFSVLQKTAASRLASFFTLW